MSTSLWNTKLSILSAVAMIALSSPSSLLAQGTSIPTNTEVKEQRDVNVLLSEELPEGVKYRYPLINGLSVSANLFPIALNLFGKEYCSYEGTATLDLHHRFFPQATSGIGYCDEKSKNVGTTIGTGDDATFHALRYHSKAYPFFKAGMLYNFNYNDLKPNDFYGALFRLGYAYTKADVENLSYNDGYWNPVGPMGIDEMEFNCIWIELGGFIKVQVAKHISMGWDMTYKPFLHKGTTRQGSPYFVPGYGTTTSNISMGFHLYYDLF